MQPYYERAGITIYHGDCRDVLPTLPRESVDLIVTDPPYGIGFVSGHRRVKFAAMVGDDGSLDVSASLRLALKALKHHRHIYVFGPADLSGLPLGQSAALIWDKGNHPSGGNTTAPWAKTHESITFAVVLGGPSQQGNGTMAARLRRGSVLSYPRLNARANGRHPTEKPVMLLRELIEMSSRFSEIVLDPFMGSGSTLEAALLEGRRAIGIEIEERYCEIAAKRLQQDVLPLEVPA